MLKTNYLNSNNKRVVQKIVFNDAKRLGFKKLVGLAGPNISNYLTFLKKMGIKKADIYENNRTQIVLQMSDFSPVINTTVKFDDIYNAPVSHETLYDLDFCCSVKYAKRHIKKFKDNAVITLSIRPIGFEKTLKQFSKLVSKLKPNIKLNVEETEEYSVHTITFPDGKQYTCYRYSDTVPMITIKPNFKP